MAKIMLLCPKDITFNFRKELIKRLLSLGHEVVLVSPYGSIIDEYEKLGCHFINCEMDRRGTSIKNDSKLIHDYYRIIKKARPNVVLTYTGKCSIYGGLVCSCLHIPYIINSAGVMKVGDRFSKLELFILQLTKISFKKARCIMNQNSYELEINCKLLKNKVKCRLIPGSGVNLDKFEYKSYPQNDKLIIFNYVARIMPSKGIDEFLECAKRIRRQYKNTEFVIYGDFDDDHYRSIINEYENKRIIKYGGVQNDMRSYIEASHAVIHPSYYEGMSNVVLEHAAMGRPCIGANVPGVQDSIEDGVTGFIFKVRDVDSLVQKVETFINLKHEEKEKMGYLARKKMEKEFSREIVTNAYIEEISSIID